MQITSHLTPHIAKAYGIARPPASVQNAQPTSAANQPQAVNAQRAIEKLTAGTVSQAINFDASSVADAKPQQPMDVLPMYNRAADRIEAATAIQVGRSIDIRG